MWKPERLGSNFQGAAMRSLGSISAWPSLVSSASCNTNLGTPRDRRYLTLDNNSQVSLFPGLHPPPQHRDCSISAAYFSTYHSHAGFQKLRFVGAPKRSKTNVCNRIQPICIDSEEPQDWRSHKGACAGLHWLALVAAQGAAISLSVYRQARNIPQYPSY